MAHTPGPWTLGVRDDGSKWLSLGDPASGPHYQGDLCASLDDARLIVAAPDLLAALKRICDYPTAQEEQALALARPMTAELLAAGRAAIAKAEGR